MKCSYPVKNKGKETDGTCNARAVSKYSEERLLCRLHYYMDKCIKLEEAYGYYKPSEPNENTASEDLPEGTYTEDIKEKEEPCECGAHTAPFGYSWEEAHQDMFIKHGKPTQTNEGGGYTIPKGSSYCTSCYASHPKSSAISSCGRHRVQTCPSSKGCWKLTDNGAIPWKNEGQVIGPCVHCGSY